MNRTEPDAWIWPDPMSDALTIIDSRNQKRAIVLDEITGRWHELGTRNGPANSGLVAAYQDKMSDRYAGAEIPCALVLREHIGRAEHEYVEHVESHAYLRPQDEANKGATGYGSGGYRSAFELEIRAYVDGEVAEKARIKNVPLGGDAVCDRNVKAHRVQMGFFTTTSEFRLAGVDQYYMLSDESAVGKAMSEHGWQDEFGRPFLWLTRGPNPLLNRATALSLTGSVFGAVTGPDGYDESAVEYAPTTGVTYGSKTLDGDFTFIYDVKDLNLPTDINGLINIYEDHGTNYLKIEANGNHRSMPLGWTGSGWVSVMVKREGNTITFGEGGNIIGSAPDNIGTITINLTDFDAQEGKRFNAMGFEYAISNSAWGYYYDDLTENHGDALLPIWQ